MDEHNAEVGRIAAQVKGFYDRKEPYRIHHGSTNTTRPRPDPSTPTLDISRLRRVVSVDAGTRTALVEPNVGMDGLVEATLPHGLMPRVVMEFPGITAGGGFAGTGGESSSFRHGFFDEGVSGVEMVLADGSVVWSRRGGDSGDGGELLGAAGGALGTLGVATLLEVQLVEARRFVRTTYRRVSSVADAVRLLRHEVRQPENVFIDAILFSPTHGAVITGQLTDDGSPPPPPPGGEGKPPRTFSGPWDPWFYLHVKEVTEKKTAAAATAATAADAADPANAADPAAAATVVTEYVPLAEYLFRYDRGGFWVGRSAFRYFFMVPFTRLTRRILDGLLHTRVMYRALHASAHSQTFFVQDVAVPFSKAEELVDYVADDLAIWPLWLCPLKRRKGPTFHPAFYPSSSSSSSTTTGGSAGGGKEDKGKDEEEDKEVEATHMLNIGIWGEGPRSHARFVAKNRAVEAKVAALGGAKWLYASTYYTEDEFWAHYGGGSRAWYDALREKYRATSLPSVYDKVKVSERVVRRRDRLKLLWPLGGLYGTWKAIRSKDYLLDRNRTWKYKHDQTSGS